MESTSAGASVRYAYPKFKVFIFGVEVSADVVAINKTEHDGAAPNTCQITLLNEHDKYIINTADILALSGNDETKLNVPWMNPSNKSKKDTEDPRGSGVLDMGSIPFSMALQGIYSDAKRQILERKAAATQDVDKADMKDILDNPIQGTNFTNYYGSSISQYPLSDGAPVFHPMDPVRVFMRDPFNPGRWYHYFCGFVSDMVENTDHNNTKSLTIVVEDPTKLFRYTRIFMNPGIIDANVVIQENDMRVQSFYSKFLKGLNLPEIFFTLIFGPDKVQAEEILQKMYGKNGSSKLVTSLRGIGHFSFDTSGVFTFGPEPKKAKPESAQTKKEKPPTKLLDVKPEIKLDKLQTWQSIIDHEVQPSDIIMMATQELRESAGSALAAKANDRYAKDGIEGIIQEIGENPQIYLVDGGRLLLLIPKSLGVYNNDIVAKDIISTYPLNSEWNSAGQIMYEVVDRIQFSMYCSPRGDLIIEPPLYDFDPDDFGMTPMSSNAFVSNLPTIGLDSVNQGRIATNILSRAEKQVPGGERGPYGPNYIIYKSDTYRWEAAFIDEKVHNIATAAYSIFHNYENLPNTQIIGDLGVAKIPNLIPLYGVRQIPITLRGYVSTKEGAILAGQITLNKLNGDAHTFKVDHTPNIKLWLNRPIYIEGRNCIATTKQVGQSLTWGEQGDMSSTSDLYATRVWEGQVAKNDPTRPIYSTIGGAASRPLDYSILFGVKDQPKKTDVTNNNKAGSTSDAVGKTSPQAAKKIKSIKKKGGV